MMFSRTINFAAAASVLSFSFLAVSSVHGQPPSDSITVGQEICTIGYVMDKLCIDYGKLLDAQQYETLENPEEHTVHCLVDVPKCYEPPFHILTDPNEHNGNTTYGPGWIASNNTLLLNEARKLGDTKTCTTCVQNEVNIQKGLRAQIHGIVLSINDDEGGGPILDINSVQYLTSDDDEEEISCTTMVPGSNTTPPSSSSSSDSSSLDLNEEEQTTTSSSSVIGGGAAASSIILMAASLVVIMMSG